MDQPRPLTRADLDAAVLSIVETLTGTFNARLDRMAEAFTASLMEVRAELSQRIDRLDQRLTSLEQRIDNLAPVILSTDARMASFTRAMDRLIAAHDTVLDTQAAQQRAIDQLAARVARIERELHPDQQ